MTIAMKNAVLFNGAGAMLSQEVALLDLLFAHEGLAIQQDETFLAGLSAGSLVTSAVQACFCDQPKFSWDYFKDEVLFPLENSDVYVEGSGNPPPFDTSPLREFVTRLVVEEAGYDTFSKLPFPNATLTLPENTLETLWINSVASGIPSGDSMTPQQIREHTAQLDLVDILMCTSAIDNVFPKQKLGYLDAGNKVYIEESLGSDAFFLDGGTRGFFKNFEEFFDAYGATFDKMYIISPSFGRFPQDVADVVGEQTAAALGSSIDLFTEDPLTEFLNALRAYNAEHQLASEIYNCQTKIKLYNPLNFGTQRVQYDETIEWGEANLDRIAVNIEGM